MLRAETEVFARVARRYDLARTLISFGTDHVWRRKVVAALPQGGRHLDLGCGTGAMLKAMAGHHYKLSVGVDVEIAMALRARHAKTPGHVVIADVNHLPCRMGAFDLVTTAYLARYFDPDTLFRIAQQVLRDGGTVVCAEVRAPRGVFSRLGFVLYLLVSGTLLGIVLCGSPRAFWHLWQSVANFCSDVIPGALQRAGFVALQEHRYLGVTAVIARKRTAA